jgi:hypothetical protein
VDEGLGAMVMNKGFGVGGKVVVFQPQLPINLLVRYEGSC